MRSRASPLTSTQAFLLVPASRLEPCALQQQAQDRLVSHHDALRLRFEQRAEGWRQWIAPDPANVALELAESVGGQSADQGARIASRCEQAQVSLNMAEGPKLRAVLFELKADQPANAC